MRTSTQALRSIALLFITSLFCSALWAQDKKVIKSIDDLPRFDYAIKGTATEVYTNQEQYDKLYQQVKTDYESLLNDYEIEDKTLKKSVLNTLKQIDFYEKDFTSAKEKAIQIKSLEEKPSAKLTSGIINMAFFKAAKSHEPGSPAFKEAFKTELHKLVDPLPWEVVQDDIEQTKGTFEIYSENLVLGFIKENMDKVVEKTGELSGDFATGLVSYKYLTQYLLPYKNEIVEVYSDYIAKHHVEKEDIWKDRDIDLTQETGLNEVIVAIWDSGVDVDLFNGQIFENDKEKPDGKDNDDNGYIDDIHGIAYDLQANKSEDLLFPLTEEQKKQLPQMTKKMKGLVDLQANVNSDESSELKSTLSQINPDEVKPFIEELSLFGNYAHGTHVAGIAAKGNPKAIIMPSRITFDYKMIPQCPTVELAKKEAKQVQETVDYFRSNGVRIVNMSFGGSPQDIEAALELNGKGETAEERKEMAREIFDIGKEAFFEAIKNAPEILFVTSAGNSDEDSEFYEAIPSSFDLPNILTVGAVDQAGEETGFTSFGENVDVHANGFEVESYIPGGLTMKMSGTSMSSPNVANLAAKLMALEPDLTVAQTIDLIKKGADKSEDERLALINPKKSIELLKSQSN